LESEIIKEFVNFLSYSKNFGKFFIEKINIIIVSSIDKSFLNKLMKNNI